MSKLNKLPDFVPELTELENYSATVSSDIRGFADIDVTYYVSTLTRAMNLLKNGKICPLIADGVVLTALFKYGSFELEDGVVYKVVLHWKGISINQDLEATEIPNFDPRGNTEPIQTHHYFTKFAGTFTNRNPASMPEFDQYGVFQRFARRLKDGSKNPKAGISNYYNPGLVVKDERLMSAEDIATTADMFNVGKIDVPDIEDLPTIHTDVYGLPVALRNYLLVSLELEDFANDYVGVNREWLLSGPWGWDTDIYEYSDTGENKEA